MVKCVLNYFPLNRWPLRSDFLYTYLIPTSTYYMSMVIFVIWTKKMVKSVQFIKFIREIQTIPKNVLCREDLN